VVERGQVTYVLGGDVPFRRFSIISLYLFIYWCNFPIYLKAQTRKPRTFVIDSSLIFALFIVLFIYFLCIDVNKVLLNTAL